MSHKQLRSSARVSVFLFAIGLAARLAFLALRGPVLGPDSFRYLALGHNLITHGWFSLNNAPPYTPFLWWPPLYPAFLGALDWFGASVTAVSLIQAIIGAASVVLVFLLATLAMQHDRLSSLSMVFSSDRADSPSYVKWSVLPAFVYSIHPGAIWMSSTILADTLFTFLLLASACVLASIENVHHRDTEDSQRFTETVSSADSRAGFDGNRLWPAVLSGILLGLATLCRSVSELLPFAFAVTLFLVPGVAYRFRRVFLLVVPFILVIAPWSIRNSLAAGRFMGLQDPSSAASLFYATTRLDWDQRDAAYIIPRLDVDLVRAAAVGRGDTAAREMPADRLFVREGLRNIRANRLAYFASRARAHAYFFLTSYDSFTTINRSLGTLWAQRDFLRLGLKLSLLTGLSLIPFVLGVIGLWSSRTSLARALAATVWIYTWIVHLPLWNETRYWLPAVPFLLVSATLGLRLVSSHWLSKRRRG